MAYLLDTNILLRLFDDNSVDHVTVFATVDGLKEQGESLYFAPQNAAEFWNVATRPVGKTDSGFRLIRRMLCLRKSKNYLNSY